MYYNEAYISDFSDEDYERALRNENGELKTIEEEYINQYRGDSNGLYLAFKESLDHYVLKKVEEDESFITSDLFKNYMNYIKRIYSKNVVVVNTKNKRHIERHIEVNTNVVFKNDKITEAFFDDISKSEDDAVFKSFLSHINKNDKVIESIRDKLRNYENLNQNELNFLATYLHLSHDFSGDLYKNFVKYVLNIGCDKNEVTIPILNAIMSYLPSQYFDTCKENVPNDCAKNARMFICKYDSRDLDYENLHVDKFYVVGENETLQSIADKFGTTPYHLARLNIGPGVKYYIDKPLKQGIRLKVNNNGNVFLYAHSSGIRKYCVFNGPLISQTSLNDDKSLHISRSRKNNDIYFWLMAGFHELTHQHQMGLVYDDNINTSGFSYIIKKILNIDLCDYQLNHDSDEIEMEADENAWLKMSAFLERHIGSNAYTKSCDENGKYRRIGRCCYDNMRDSSFRRIFSHKVDKDGNLILYSTYDIQELKRIIEKEPNIIYKYPMLRKIFKSTGEFDPSLLFKHNIVFDSKNSFFGENNAGVELGSYLLNSFEYIDSVLNYINDNDLSENQIVGMASSLSSLCFFLSLKLEYLDDINPKRFDDTKAKCDLSKSSEFDKLYNFYANNIFRNVLNGFSILFAIQNKYPTYSFDVIISNYKRYFNKAIEKARGIDEDLRHSFENYQTSSIREFRELGMEYSSQIDELLKNSGSVPITDSRTI